MPLSEEEQALRNELITRFCNQHAFLLRATKRHGQRVVSLVLVRDRLAITDSRLHELRGQLKFDFTKRRIVLSGKLADIQHAIFRILSSGEILFPGSLPKAKPPIRRRFPHRTAIMTTHH